MILEQLQNGLTHKGPRRQKHGRLAAARSLGVSGDFREFVDLSSCLAVRQILHHCRLRLRDDTFHKLLYAANISRGPKEVLGLSAQRYCLCRTVAQVGTQMPDSVHCDEVGQGMVFVHSHELRSAFAIPAGTIPQALGLENGRALRVILFILVVIPMVAIAIFKIWVGVRGAWLFPVILILVLVSEMLRRRSAARAKENHVGGKSDSRES